jgi:hypothetical protein
MMLSNRSKGVLPPGSSASGITKVDCFGLVIGFSAFLAFDDSGLGEGAVVNLPCQLLIGQASASHSRKNFRNSASVPVSVLALVITECLFVKVAEQVERLDADIGAFQPALQQRPEVFDTVRMYVAANVFLGVVDELVNVVFFKTGIGRQFVSEHFGTRFDGRANFLLQRAPLPVRKRA